MIYLGVDPGKEGAIAALDENGALVSLAPTPLVESARGRDEYDLPGIMRALSEHRLEFAHAGECRIAMVTVEKLQPMPLQKGGAIANYNRGVAHGWAWMLTALRLPFTLVAPQRWQRAMLEGTPGDDTGQRSIIAAQRLWPLARLTRTERSRKPSDGMSDALLIAEFGRRAHRGQAS